MILLGLLLVIPAIVFSVAAPLIAPASPYEQNLMDRLTPPLGGLTHTYLLGTDSLGRDILSRIIYGSRISLIVGITVVLIGGTIGTTIGVLSGFFGGMVDTIAMRVVDIFLAFPFILLALAMMVVLGPGLWNVILVLGVTSWIPYARVARGKVLAIKEKEFIEAARALGMGVPRIVFRHILPNTLSSILVIASFRVAGAIIGEATLSFLGLGVTPGTPSWGAMLSEGRTYLMIAWWPATLPGLAIMVTVLGINLIGDGVRDVLDPKL
jgi:peptide/nickel transport system permease protein